MSSVTNWFWKDGKPPGPQTARAGENWTFHLPLAGTGPVPTIEWLDIPDGLTIAPAPGDPLTFYFHIPDDLHGIQTLSYRRAGESRADELLLKILPASTSPASGSAAASVPRIVDQRMAPHREPPHPPRSRLPAPEDIRPSGHPPIPPPSTPMDVAESQGALAPRLDPDREYEIQVYRHGILIQPLSRPLTPHRSLLVGKFSASKAVFPDIDLRHHFATTQAAALCSRQQARIYWSHGRIQILNIGQSPIGLPDGRGLTKDQVHAWTPGEDLTLPGGLTLRLAIQGY